MEQIEYCNYQEFLAAWKAKTNLNQKHSFYQAILEVLEEAVVEEQKGHHLDPATILPSARKRFEVFVRAVPEAS